MTLTDTGPLVALINRNDPNHARCLDAVKTLPAGSLITTWPCFTEAMYLLYRAAGHPGQAGLWRWRSAGRLILLDLTFQETDRMAALMIKYQIDPWTWPMPHLSWLPSDSVRKAFHTRQRFPRLSIARRIYLGVGPLN